MMRARPLFVPLLLSFTACVFRKLAGPLFSLVRSNIKRADEKTRCHEENMPGSAVDRVVAVFSSPCSKVGGGSLVFGR